MVCGAGGGFDLCDALDGLVRESWQDVGQVVAHGDLEPAAAFDDGEDRLLQTSVPKSR
jgi:hypothetical protein